MNCLNHDNIVTVWRKRKKQNKKRNISNKLRVVRLMYVNYKLMQVIEYIKMIITVLVAYTEIYERRDFSKNTYFWEK